MIELLYAHAGLISLGFAALFAGAMVAALMRKRWWWLKTHRFLGLTGAIVVVLALFAVVLQISLTGRDHMRVPHAYIGVAAVILVVLTPVLGLLQFRIPGSAAKIRRAHVWSGRIALVLMFINILIGLSMIGLI